MTKSSWGGKRDNAGSGGPRNGAGRPRKHWNSGGKGHVWFVEFSTPGGFPSNPQQWRVLNVDEDGTIEFQNIETEEIISLIDPNNYD